MTAIDPLRHARTAVAVLALGAFAFASDTKAADPVEDGACDPNVSQALDQAVQNEINQAIQEIDMGIEDPVSVKSLACLDAIMDAGGLLDILFSPPSLNDLLGQLEDQICDAVDDAWNTAAGNLEENFSIDGFQGTPFEGEILSVETDIYKNQNQAFEVQFEAPPELVPGGAASQVDSSGVSEGFMGTLQNLFK